VTYERIEELSEARKAIEASVVEIKGRQVDNVVDLDGVFRLLKIFNKGFPALPAHQQRDLIRNIISGIVITGPGVAKIQPKSSDWLATGLSKCRLIS